MHSSPAPDVGWLDLVAGWSEMGEMVRDFEWESTSLGAPERWSIGLRSAVVMCLSSKFPMLVVWGGELGKVYNDANRSILGTEKHPGALGAPATSIWPEAPRLSVRSQPGAGRPRTGHRRLHPGRGLAHQSRCRRGGDAARLLHGTGSVHDMAERLLHQLMPQQDADDIVLVVKYLPPT